MLLPVLSPPQKISIHALREEGDQGLCHFHGLIKKFLSTPSARRATDGLIAFVPASYNFYPRPPRGGRLAQYADDLADELNFYPRPPRGGRQAKFEKRIETMTFLSTPSARRATWQVPLCAGMPHHFYPRPPRGGRLEQGDVHSTVVVISIHALREEGDFLFAQS